MAIDYTEEAKFGLLEGGSANWGSVFNAIAEALDAGAELTFTFGETVIAGDVIAISAADGQAYKSVSNDSTLTPAIGFAPNAVTSGNTGKVRWFGWIDIDTSWSVGDSVSWSPGECAYVGSVAGRLAKSQYSWANAVAICKEFTDASFNTRFRIKPKNRCRELVGGLKVEETVVFDTEYDNGNSGAAATIDWTNGNKQKLVLSANSVLSFAHPFGICTVTLKVQQDGVGSRTVTWPPSVKWASGTAPTLTTTADGIDIIAFYWDGLDYYGSAVLDFQ
jgi:hypothetical protein